MAEHDPSCGVDRPFGKALSAELDVPERGLAGASPKKPDGLEAENFLSISKVIGGHLEAIKVS